MAWSRGSSAGAPFSRAPAACWWARTIVESTDTAHLTSSSASAWATRAVNTRSHVPSTAHIRSRLYTPRQLPYFSGRCTHWVPVWNL